MKNPLKIFIKQKNKGSFTKWCKSKGFDGVTTGCINLGLKHPSLKIRKKAIFAKNFALRQRKKKKTAIV